MGQRKIKMTEVKLDRPFWEKRYLKNDIGWDIGYPNPIFIDYANANIPKDKKILVPGAGSGYEVSALWEMGYSNIYAIDLSDKAKERFLRNTPNFPEEQYLTGNFFELQNTFDFVFEQTFFCAINPTSRQQYVKHLTSILNTNGRLFGVLFSKKFEGGPPFGGSMTEYQSLFQATFEILQLEKNANSIAPRQGKELIIELMKK